MAVVEVAVSVCRTGEDEVLVRAEVARAGLDRAVRLSFARGGEGLQPILGSAEVLFGERITPELLRAAPRLKWAHVNVAGVERSMSPELSASPVVLTNSRAMHKVWIAEHVLGVMLGFAKRLHVAVRAQSRREWVYDEISTTSWTLERQTLAILGLGAIGLEVARLAAAFGMRCTGTKRRLSPGWTPPDWMDRVTDESGTDSLLAEADVVVLALPLTERTRGVLSRERIQKMKRGAILVNIARGALVDEAALAEALRAGSIGGAGLDVFQEEPLVEESPFWGMEKVIVTPHVSGNYPVYARDAARMFVANLGRYLRGERLENVVDKEEGY